MTWIERQRFNLAQQTRRGFLFVIATLVAAPAQAAPELWAGAGAIGGAGNGNIGAGCTTYGPLPFFSGFFGTAYGIGVPVGGIGPCGYAGQQIENFAFGGTASAVQEVGPVILGNPGFAGFYTGTASANAEFLGLSVAAAGDFSDGLAGTPLALSNSSSAALLRDSLTLTSPLVAPGSAGFVGYRFQVAGSLSAPGAPASFFVGESIAEVVFRHGVGASFSAARFHARRGDLGISTSGGVPLAGWSTSTGQAAGDGTVRTVDFLLPFPIVFGQPWDFALGLGVNTFGETAASFLSTARLVGLDVFDAQNQPVANFTLSAESGTSYLPEPSGAAAWLTGLAWLLTVGHPRNRRVPRERKVTHRGCGASGEALRRPSSEDPAAVDR